MRLTFFEGDRRIDADALTDADGLAEFDPPRGPATVNAWTATEAAGPAHAAPGDDAPIELQLSTVGVVSGLVLDADTRAPVPGATVRCATFREDVTARTDAEGEFSLAVVPSRGQGQFLEARGPSHGASSVVLQILSDGSWSIDTPGPAQPGLAARGLGPSVRGARFPARIEILLPRARSIRGRLLDADGIAAAGFTVSARAYFWSGHGVATPDEAATVVAADGTFELATLRSDVAHRVDAASGSVRARIAELPPDGAVDCDLGTIRLERPGTVRGLVATADGRSVAAATVALIRRSAAPPPGSRAPASAADVAVPITWSAVSDLAGRFVVEGVQPGSYACRASVEGRRKVEVELEVISGEQGSDVRLVSPGDAWCLQGVVRWSGPPGAPTTIVLRGIEDREARTGPDGTFAFGALDPSVEYRVDAEARSESGEILAGASVRLTPWQESLRVDLVPVARSK